MTSTRRHFLAVCVLLLAVTALAPMPAPPTRVVAVGDVHGDLQGLKAILRDADILDGAGRWVGGETIVVQTGDLIDRGAESRAVLDFVMALERQASRAGGRLVVLLGNHDAMNLLGDLRYVTAPEFAAYGDGKSEQRRQAAWQRYQDWLKNHGAPPVTAAMQTEWLQNHPPGYVEQRDAFGPQGRYGKWLRQRPAVVMVGDSLFVHGGLNPTLGSLPPNEINARLARDFRAFDEARAALLEQDEILPFFAFAEIVKRATSLAAVEASAAAPAAEANRDATDARVRAARTLVESPQWLSVSRDGPLWFRGLAEWSDEEGTAAVRGILEKQKAARIVIGHTTQEGRIRARWDGRVFLIDTGMLQSYKPGGRGSALEIVGSRITAIYGDGKVPLNPESRSDDPAWSADPRPTTNN
jgi:Calcineurin-like phosphoesterase